MTSLAYKLPIKKRYSLDAVNVVRSRNGSTKVLNLKGDGHGGLTVADIDELSKWLGRFEEKVDRALSEISAISKVVEKHEENFQQNKGRNLVLGLVCIALGFIIEQGIQVVNNLPKLDKLYKVEQGAKL